MPFANMRLSLSLVTLMLFFVCVKTLPAQNKADSLLNIWENKQLSDTVRLKAVKQLAWECYAFTNTDTATIYARAGYEFAVQKKNKKYMSVMLNTLGSISAVKGEFYQAIDMYTSALKIQIELKDYYGVSKTYNNIGYIYRNQGKFAEALEYQLKSIQLQEKYKYMDFRITTLINIGITYQEFNDYQLALKYYLKALKLAEASEDLVQVADIQNNIGLIYIDQKDYLNALKLFRKNVDLYEKSTNYIGLASSLLDIGLCYAFIGKTDSSLANYSKALNYFEKVGDKQGIIKALNNIGKVYENNSRFDAALKYYGQSLELSKRIDSKKEIANALGNIGYIYKKQGKVIQAKPYLEESLKFAQESGSIEQLSHSASYLWDIYKTTREFEKALKMYELYTEMKDSISSDEKQKLLLKATIKFGYEKKAAADSVANAKQIEIKNGELNKQRVQIVAKRNEQIALFAGLFLVLIFSGFMYNRFKVTQNQKVIIETAHTALEEKSKEILDSITYSKRIQKAILPSDRIVKELLKDSFILYLPKDIVAGDFYWLEHLDQKIYIAVCDCTGHGVPGAMVSVVCNNALNRALNEFGKRLPGELFDKTRDLVLESFSKSDDDVKDGMDASLAVLDMANRKLKWSGANNPLWIYRKAENSIEEIKADKQPIGKGYETKPFTTNEINLNEGDIFYLFTDGFADQFGGKKSKKLTKAKFRDFMLSIAGASLEEQRTALLDFHNAFRGTDEQVDDICVIGVRV